MSEAFPYDALESDHEVCFVLSCAPPAARRVVTTILDETRMELSCGRWLVRIANLHPSLRIACATKPISVAACGDEAFVLRGPEGIHAPAWRRSAFRWHFDPGATTARSLAARPFPRTLAISADVMVLATLEEAPRGPPFALCASSRVMTALPVGRTWHRVSNRLLVDADVLSGTPPRQDAGRRPAPMVVGGVPGDATTASWRPQLALLASTA